MPPWSPGWCWGLDPVHLDAEPGGHHPPRRRAGGVGSCGSGVLHGAVGERDLCGKPLALPRSLPPDPIDRDGPYAWVGGDSDRQMARSMGLLALASVPAMVALSIGALLDPGPRIGFWAAAILLELLAGVVVRGVAWRVHVSHFAERHAGHLEAGMEATLTVVAPRASPTIVLALLGRGGFKSRPRHERRPWSAHCWPELLPCPRCPSPQCRLGLTPRAPTESWSPTASVRADIADEYAPVRGVARRHASGDAGDIAAGRTT